MQVLAGFIRQHKEQILEKWLAVVCTLPSADGLAERAARDHMPEILDSLADAIEREDWTGLPLKGLPNLHAALRARAGYDLRQVVAEYRALRRVIHELYSERGGLDPGAQKRMPPLRLMHAAIDSAIADAVDQYAVDSDRAREMFIGMLGHDLRVPLAAIVAGAGALAATAGAPHVQDIARRMGSSAQRMEEMIAELLDLARGRLGGGLPIATRQLDANVLVQDTISEIAYACADRTIVYQPQDGGDYAVEWDGPRIAQALSNLVSNAVTHGEDPIVIEPCAEDESVTIQVRNGGEISPDVLPRLFAPFAHAGPDRRQSDRAEVPERRRGSLGLGLYIVRQIVEAHGGTIHAGSSDGETRVTMTLPRRSPSTSARDFS